jgi:hypothetical protein
MRHYLEKIDIEYHPDSYYIVNTKQPFFASGYCFDSNLVFIEKSNDWCYLLSGSINLPYLGNNYKSIDEKVIPLIVSFQTGVHAYAGIYSILLNYFKFFNNSEYKFIVYKELQSGILEIIKNLIDESRLIILDPDILYKFKEVVIIPNSLHSFLENESITMEISNLIQTKFVNSYEKEFNKIAILKKPNSSVTSNLGTIDSKLVDNFCEKNKYKFIEPFLVGEVNTINILSNCDKVVFSWGTTFMKNFIYLSNRCERADVLINGAEFYNEYRNAMDRGILIKKFKNCEFFYHINPDINNLLL